MIKYICWIFNPSLKGWVLSPFNILYSNNLTLEQVEQHFLQLYPDRLIRIETIETEPKDQQLRLF
jgi:hypothetical protein